MPIGVKRSSASEIRKVLVLVYFHCKCGGAFFLLQKGGGVFKVSEKVSFLHAKSGGEYCLLLLTCGSPEGYS
jgi:hypothetical protein